jgi:hypothetical protein
MDEIDYFNFIASLIFTIIAIIGNSLVLIILSKPKLRKESLFRYFIVTTIVDSINILLIWPFNFPDAFQINSSEISCKLFNYLPRVFYQFSPWINVLSSIDRLLAVKYAHRFKFRNELKYQLLAILLIFVTILLVDFPNYYYPEISLNQTSCIFPNWTIWLFIDLYAAMMAVILPFSIMIITSVLTVRQLIKSKLKINKTNFENEKQLIKVSFGINFLFLISNIAYVNLLIVCDAIQKVCISDESTKFAYAVLFQISNIYLSCNFFIYLSFNKIFRSYATRITCCKNSIEPVDVLN